MCRKNLYKLIIPVLIFIIMGAPNALGTNTIRTRFFTAYPSAVGSRLATLSSAPNHCGACHFAFSSADADISNLNPYGLAVQSGGFGSAAAIAAIGSQDSDSDGFTNDEEINGTGFTNVPTFPGLTLSNVSSVSGVTVSQLTGFLVPVAVGPTGSLLVTIDPNAAVAAGAQWSVDGGVTWQDSNTTVTGLSVGSHTVTYKTVALWTAPVDESVSITDGNTTITSGTYTLTPVGSLQVTLDPNEAVAAGAQWRVDGGAWQDSNATVTGLSVGSHPVTYKPVTGWTAPAGESAIITDGNTTAISSTYILIPQSGSLKVTLGPSGAVGAQWSVDGGTTWQNSNATVTSLPVGSHTVDYKAVTGWTAPASESVTITNNATTQISRSYTLAPLGRVILVYTTTLKVNPAASRDSESEGWQTGTGSAKAYMVIDVNLSDPNVDNIQAALIPYGKGVDPNDSSGTVKKVYVDDAEMDISGFAILPGFETSSTKFKPDVWVFDFMADNAAAERVEMGIVDARMQGTVKVTDVSPTETGNVATSPKGVAIEDSLYNDTFVGSGTFAAKLDSKNTNRANDPAVWNGDFDAVVTGLKQILGDQGYIPVTQTP